MVHHAVRVDLFEVLGVIESFFVDRLRLLFAEPFDSLAVFPQAVLNFVFLGHVVDAEAVLFAPVPVAFIDAAVCPLVHAITVFLVVPVKALVNSAIGPGVHADTFHVVLVPLSFEGAAIEPLVHSDA